MTPAPLRRALRGGIGRIRHVTPVPPRAATGPVARIYAAVEEQFGLLAPPVALHSPDPILLAAAWTLLRETVLAAGTTTRAEREVVAAAVSLANACPYCVQVHGAILGGIHGRADSAALAAGDLAGVADPRLRALAEWAWAGGRTAPPVAGERMAEAIGVLFAFHMINRIVAVYLDESPLPPSLPAAAAGTASALLGRLLAPTARRPVVPGAGMDLLPDAGSGPAWAAARPPLAAALARVSAAVAAAGSRVLGAAARAAVEAAVVAHVGHAARPPALTADWISPLLVDVPGADQPATRLALLTAVSPHRVRDAEVAAVRAVGAGDAELLAITAWAAHCAAQRAAAAAAEPTVAAA